MMGKRVIYLTNWLPHYRRGLYQKLLANEGFEFTIFCQKTLFSKEYENIISLYPQNIKTVKYRDFFNGKISWQFLPWYDIYKNSDILIIDSNPRILTHFLMATLYRILGRKVVLYSMVHSHNNNRLNKFLRITWMRMFHYHLLYNDDEVHQLNKIGFGNKKMVAYNNGLDQKEIEVVKSNWTPSLLDKWKNENGIKKAIDVLAVGRTTIGKYEILIEAIGLVKKVIPDVSAFIIGDGNGAGELKRLIKQNNLEENVTLVGALHEEEKLAPYFLSSNVFVHSYAIGLSINHAFGYGVPIITHDDPLYHGPEICLFKNGVTGLAYKNGNPTSLSDQIINMLNDKSLAYTLGQNGLKLTQQKYNTDNMASNLIQFLNKI
jgi:glycosyltransferase involved in cell wall biosynthesis